MTMKMTMFFNFGGQGWSESWYNNAGALPSDANVSPYKDLANARFALTAKYVQLMGWRVTDVLNPRSSTVYRYPNPAITGELPDVASSAWLIDVKAAGSRGTRQLWLRGVADDWTKYDAAASRFTFTGTIQRRFNTLTALMINSSWMVRNRKPLATSTSSQPITLVNVPPAGIGVDLTLGAGGPVVDTKPVVITGFRKPLSFLNGTYQPFVGYSINGSILSLRGKSLSGFMITTYRTGAWARNTDYDYNAISSMNISYVAERKVGKAFFVPRGRRSAR